MDQPERCGEATGDEVADSYLKFRSLMFTIAYQMTGSVEDAEDIVSEVFLRYRRTLLDGVTVQSSRAFLTAVTTRLAIDYLRKARHDRESYVGPWLPEPLVGGAEPDVAEHAELADSLSMAFLVLLESLNPVERAAFLLREVFQYDYADIASIVGKTETNCRQLVKRARERVAERKPRFEASRRERDRIAQAFFTALQDGDLETLVGLLAADVVAYGDGGGEGPSLPRPVYGRHHVARLVRALSHTIRTAGLQVYPASVNGQPGAMVHDGDGLLLNVLSIDILDGQVQAVRSVINPRKLRHLGPLLDPRTLRGRDGASGPIHTTES